MSKAKIFDKQFIKKIAALSKLDLNDHEVEYYASQFNKTLETISDLKKVDTEGIPEAYNVTGLKNIFREDEVDTSRILDKDEVFKNAKKTHNGYFVVKGILNEK